MKILTAVSLVIASMITTAVHAAEYYVAADGSDSNTGTSPSQAWKSLSQVEGQMSQFTADANSEDVIIYFNNGDTWLNDELKITCIGSAAHWITFDGTAWGDNASGTSKATIRRTSSGTKNLIQITYGSGSYDQDAYVIVQGFELDGNSQVDNTLLEGLNASCVKILNNKIHDPYIGSWVPTVHFTTSANVTGTIEIHDLEVSNNEIHGAGAHGVAFYPRTGSGLDNVGNITVLNNKIYDFGNSSSSSYAAGIQVVSCVGGTICGNVIYDGYGSTDGFGMNLETRNRRCQDIDIYNNIIYGGSGVEICVGIASVGGQNNDVYNNVIANTGSEAIHWGGATGNATGRIFNNTIFNTGLYAIGITSSSQVDELYNNIIYQTSNVQAVNNGSLVVEHSNNNFYNTVSGRSVVGSYTTENWASNWEPSGRDGDPGFVNLNALPTAFDENRNMYPTGLNITESGDAYANGTDLSSIFTTDINGNTRAAPWEIGASEYATGEVFVDEAAPSVPVNISAAVSSSTELELSWNASTDNVRVSGYRIFRDGQEVGISSSTSYSDSGLAESTLYTYTVSAYDSSGNESDLSQAASATTLSEDDMVSTSAWQNTGFESQDGQFDVEFDIVPYGENIDAVTGLALGDATYFDSLGVIVRFNPDGQIDVRNGGVYTYDTAVSYSAGTEYHFRLSVDLSAHTYSVYVQAGAGSEILIADDYAFRTSQSAVGELDTLAVTAVTGSHMVSGFSVEEEAAVAVVIPVPPSGLRVIPSS
jgi:hypothetical protein